jgi:ribosomal protein L29
MKAKEVHKLSDDEIEAELKRLRQRSFELRTQAVTEKIEDTSQFATARRDIARLLTERSMRRHKTLQEIAGKRT